MANTEYSTVLERIKTGAFKTDRLSNVAENVENSPNLTGSEKEAVLNEIKKRLRVEDPAQANKLFGSVSKEATEILEAYLVDLTSRIDLSGNKHGTKVKTGGVARTGEYSMYEYLSYRCPNTDILVSLSLVLPAGEADTKILVRKQTLEEQAADGENCYYREFQGVEFSAASELFERYLTKVIG